ncbi:sulfur carrier protein ThiS adenylyltransferase ThiF [Campylobacter pinnipediorum]|uniref:sulfur carrier protein ThiS adenylyltransferase ThiF n=1 Tax=Campylobacter pinnipediorum TaxID=1965231 RepID=UPI00084E076E|nr:sulfur carrier protein ThiS adenylyltransferase ThiF [Campylobacter pinnipediorum]
MSEIYKRNVKGTLEALNRQKIIICGAGGIGSNLAVMLVRSGLKNLSIVDFDIVEQSNLNRQYYFKKHLGMPKVKALKSVLTEIDDVCVDDINQKITQENAKEILSGFDIICEAFDDASQKAFLTNYVLLNFKNSLIIASSGMSGLDGDIKTKKINENFYLCGDGVSDMSIGVMSPRVSICAGNMANLILKLSLERG